MCWAWDILIKCEWAILPVTQIHIWECPSAKGEESSEFCPKMSELNKDFTRNSTHNFLGGRSNWPVQRTPFKLDLRQFVNFSHPIFLCVCCVCVFFSLINSQEPIFEKIPNLPVCNWLRAKNKSLFTFLNNWILIYIEWMIFFIGHWLFGNGANWLIQMVCSHTEIVALIDCEHFQFRKSKEIFAAWYERTNELTISI